MTRYASRRSRALASAPDSRRSSAGGHARLPNRRSSSCTAPGGMQWLVRRDARTAGSRLQSRGGAETRSFSYAKTSRRPNACWMRSRAARVVGHSYGGAVITAAAAGNPNVKALVYVDAFAPDSVKRSARCCNAIPIRTRQGASPGRGRLPLYRPGEVSRGVRQRLAPTAGAPRSRRRRSRLPAARSASHSPLRRPGKTVPSWYVLGTQDRAINPSSSASWRSG